MNVYIPGTGFATQGPCADGFHIPLSSERTNVINAGVTLGAWTDTASTQSNISNYLSLPKSGYIPYFNSSAVGVGQQCWYWCSNQYANAYGYMIRMDFSNNTSVTAYDKGYGFTIRAFANVPVQPDSNWTVVYQGTGDAGIFSNSSLGLISISADGTTRYTLKDKNEGATNKGDYGKYFQWGNCYGFSSSPTTSSTAVSAAGYGPGNYYTSSTFINVGAWDSSNNANLRGGTDGNVNVTMMKELKNAYIGEYVPPYLCFTAEQANSTVKLTKRGSPTTVTLENSTDGTNWNTYTFGTAITLTNVGDKVYWRNTSTTDTGFSSGFANCYQFVMTGSIIGSGDTNYLLNKNSTTTVPNNGFYRLFHGCTSLKVAPSLPATTIGNSCYSYMFFDCSSLSIAPSLPATTLKTSCYAYMFRNCSSLADIPNLSFTATASECCAYMFQGCSRLRTLPKLLTLSQTYTSITLADRCFLGMFFQCSLIKLSSTQTGDYQTAYKIPTKGIGTIGANSLADMFLSTGGTFTGTPTINTTYYTSNAIV